MLSSLIPKLRKRFGDSAAECGASSSEVANCQSVTSEFLRDVLEESRIEYSTFNTQEDILTFNVSSNLPQIILPYEPFAITGVFTRDLYSFDNSFIDTQVPRRYLANYYADPAIARVEATYYDYNNPEATFIKHGKTIRITSPISPASVAEIHVHRMRDWNEIPEWGEPIIIKMSLIKLIDQTTMGSGTLLRIPTPTGYFEFDGGRVMQNLRTKLDSEVMRSIQPRTHGITQG